MDALLMSLADAADALGLSLRSVNWLIATNRLPSKKIGRRRLVPRRAVEELATRGLPGRIRPIGASDGPERARAQR